jgi:hypothetical protein
MVLSYLNSWLLFTIFYGLLLMVTFLMGKQSKYFYTKDPIVRKFSIMELKIPATSVELKNLIKGLYALPLGQSQKTVAALLAQLKLGFLFMPLAYGSIFLLSWRVASKMHLHLGYYVFVGFAVIQIVPWLIDIVENLYLINKIQPGIKETDQKNHKQHLLMEGIKWTISLTATVCCVSAVSYFWLTGNYSNISLWYLVVVFAETVVFLACEFFSRNENKGNIL